MFSQHLVHFVHRELEAECTAKCRSTIHASLIINAITKGNDEEIVSFMKTLCHKFWHVKDCYGRNALHVAASCGKWRVVRYLLQKKHCDCNIRDEESGWTPLHRSLFYGQLMCAKILQEFGASLLPLDHDHLTPLDLVMKDRPIYIDYPSAGLYEVYVWGTNHNYNLGFESQQSKHSPELLATFHKGNISIIQIVMCEYHTVFLSQCGQVFTCGHGQGGRLGHGVEHTLLTPHLLKTIKKDVCVQIAAGKDHNVILMENGCVWTWGSNKYHQLGHRPPPESLLIPKLINGYKGIKIIGVCAARFHSVMYTDDTIYTFGLNAGQLGIKAVIGKFQTAPQVVSALTNEGINFTHVAASNGATVCVTKKGDVYVLHEYQCRKIATRRYDVAKVIAIGGKLDPKVDPTELKDPSSVELKILLLMKSGRIYIWSESYSQLAYCFLSLNRPLKITDIALFNTGLLMSTNDGEGFFGSINSPKIKVRKAEETRTAKQSSYSTKMSKSFSEWIDRDESFYIELKRIANIHRGTAVACDHKGRNFAILQAHPKNSLLDVPQISPSEMPTHMESLFREADLYDDIHDAVIKVGRRNFPVHQYILASRCPAFWEKFQAVKATQIVKNQRLTIKESTVHPDIMEQILEYLYSNKCRLLTNGELCNISSVNSIENANQDNMNFHFAVPPDIIASTRFQKSSPLKSQKNLKKERRLSEKSKPNSNPLKMLQGAAGMLGIRDLKKRVKNVKVVDGRIYTDGLPPESSLKFDRKLLLELTDIVLKSEDDIKFQCHKCILMARSEYFRGMLANKWKEASSPVLTLPTPGIVLEIVIDWLYTNETPTLYEIDSIETLCHALVTADHFLIPLLKEQCEKRLTEILSLRDVCELLEFSNIYNANQLKSACMNFINLNLCTLLEAKCLQILSDETLVELTKSYRQMVPQMAYRTITPFEGVPSMEYLRAVADKYPVNIEESDENSARDDSGVYSKERKRAKNKQRSRIRKSSGASYKQSESRHEPESKPESEVNGINCITANATKEDISECAPPSPTQTQHSYLETSPLNSPKWLDSSEDMNTAFPDLLSAIKKNVHKRSVERHDSGSLRIPKLSRKQRKKVIADQTVASPLLISHSLFVERSSKSNKRWDTAINTFSPVPLKEIMDLETKASAHKLSPSTLSSSVETKNVWHTNKNSETLSFSNILQEEQEKFHNFMKIKNKPFRLIQIEDQAIEELLKYYANDDENVTVERISPVAPVTPIWKVRK